ncbi:MAG TPA: hypothetical protein VFW97_15145, partial [Acidimicrobiia bacterium]|nr:hypothetical protein [Acidimicrobiia bacterium]
DNVRAGAIEAVRADLALRAVISQEQIAATDEELDAEIERIAQQLDEKVPKVRKDLERRGVIEAVRSDIARSKALAFLMDHAEVVDADGNTVDLSLPQPPVESEGSESATSDSEASEGAEGDSPVIEEPQSEGSEDQSAEAAAPDEPAAAEEEPAS